MIEIVKYSSDLKVEWDNFVSRSKNATFLFNRNYMDYHSDRFEDHSLMFFKDNKLLSLLPANLNGSKLISHGGLTYGGFLTTDKINTPKVLNLFEALKEYLLRNELDSVVYKAIPHIYHRIPAEEDAYALFVNNAEIVKREVSSTIQLENFKPNGKKVNGAKKAENEGVNIIENSELTEFFNIVNGQLRDKYKVSAVHTSDEMELLKARFSDNIKFFGAYTRSKKLVGGALIYETDMVAHAQYLASSNEGKKLRIMDFIVVWLLKYYSGKKRWFDFGISTEDAGRYLNENLIRQKEEFGASAITYDTYELKVK